MGCVKKIKERLKTAVMAHPKRKISKTRRDKRRTHYKAVAPQIATCSTTGESHLYHRAHWHEGKLYYRGKVLIDNSAEVDA
jgi:large subunit ribosomal protein L32